jgi:CRP-like cAMP-binding protein
MQTQTAIPFSTAAEPLPGALALLRSCNRPELRAVRTLGAHLHVERGQVVCRAGEPADELFVLLAGSVLVGEEPAKRCRLGPGAGFGEMAPLARTPRRHTVVAFAPSDMLVFHRREFAALLERAPRVGRALLRAASSRLRPAPHRLEEVGA